MELTSDLDLLTDGSMEFLVGVLTSLMPRDVHRLSEITVTSAPVSTLKGTSCPFTSTVQFHVVAWSIPMTLRKAIS